MAEYIDKKDLEEYIELGYSAKQILSLFDVGECPYADVVEREKIDKAIEDAYRIRNDVLCVNGCYEPNDVLDIVDQITKLFEEI